MNHLHAPEHHHSTGRCPNKRCIRAIFFFLTRSDFGTVGVLRSHDSPPTVATRVREILQADLAKTTTIDSVAEQLSTHRRKLQRQLRNEGTNYQAILNSLREGMAKQLLAQRDEGQPRTLPKVASALGYTGVSGLHRAFRRWTRSTPAKYRDRALSDSPRSPSEGDS